MAMMTPDQESIDTFINITGSSKLVAIHKLMEHGGGLNEAVNSYFAERDTNNRHETFVAVPHDDFMSIDETHRGCRKSHPSVSPSAPRSSTLPDYGIEEKKIQAATDASKRKSETGQPDVPTEQEKVLGELESEAGPSEIRTSKSAEVEEVSTLATSNERLGVGSLAALEEAKEYPVRRRSPRTNLGSPSSPALQQNVNNSDEWGGISSEEHNEAVMLEAAMFCGLSEGGARDRVRYNTRNRYTRNRPGRFNGPYARPVPLSPSPTLIAQRLIREQQNDEYLESLKADREKEAAREAAMKEEERKLEQQQETERQIAAKEASLPQEPACDDENAVTLLVRMPDGSRRSRRFMKTDKLQYLFDFVDVGRAVKPSTYRLVRPYPRRAFSDDDSHLTLNDLGLTSKQEALFLEFI